RLPVGGVASTTPFQKGGTTSYRPCDRRAGANNLAVRDARNGAPVPSTRNEPALPGRILHEPSCGGDHHSRNCVSSRSANGGWVLQSLQQLPPQLSLQEGSRCLGPLRDPYQGRSRKRWTNRHQRAAWPDPSSRDSAVPGLSDSTPHGR